MSEPLTATAKPYPWKLFGVLYGAGLLAAVALLPYVQEQFKQIGAHMKVPPPHLGTLQLLLPVLVQSAILLAISVGVGLLLAGKIGLGAPILSAWLDGKPAVLKGGSIIFRSIIAGLISVSVAVALLVWYFIPRIPQILAGHEDQYPVWKRFLAGFYGGIAEETLCRLFLMTLFAWMLGKMWQAANGLPAVGAFWTANIAAAVLFGLGHLPTAAALGMPMNATLVADAVLVNGVLGVTFGWLYWKHGIESAMIAHFTADMVLHVLGPYFVH
jgi:hypothetical protein